MSATGTPAATAPASASRGRPAVDPLDVLFGVAESMLFLSAFASLSDPTCSAYYDRKRAEGKRHNVALICLAAAASTSSTP